MTRGRVLGAILVAASALLLIGITRAPTPPAHHAPPAPAADGAPVFCVQVDRMRSGETLYELLLRHEVDPRGVVEVAAALDHVLPPRRLQAGDELQLLFAPDRTLAALEIGRSRLERFSVERTGDAYRARVVEVPVDTVLCTVHGRLDGNLWNSFQTAGAPPEIIVAFTEIFAWTIDFFREAQPGDEFGARFSELRVDDEPVQAGPIEAAYYVRGGDTLWAFSFPEGGELKYFDRDGQSLQKALMRAPLKFNRVSSSFSRRRLHPLHRVYRPHNGVDYAAPQGTPVYAAGDGQIRYKGWKNGLGRCVEIRHPNGYRTIYGHLYKFARDIETGQSVRQRQLIGYVGKTGDASGYHLHYEVRQGNVPVNPRTLSLPAKGPVPPGSRAAFEARRDSLYYLLLPVYGPLLADLF